MAELTIKLPQERQKLLDITRLICIDTLLNLKESLDDELANRKIELEHDHQVPLARAMNMARDLIDNINHEIARSISDPRPRLDALLKLPPR